jgi:hypothetical protein
MEDWPTPHWQRAQQQLPELLDRTVDFVPSRPRARERSAASERDSGTQVTTINQHTSGHCSHRGRDSPARERRMNHHANRRGLG